MFMNGEQGVAKAPLYNCTRSPSVHIFSTENIRHIWNNSKFLYFPIFVIQLLATISKIFFLVPHIYILTRHLKNFEAQITSFTAHRMHFRFLTEKRLKPAFSLAADIPNERPTGLNGHLIITCIWIICTLSLY